MKVLVTQHIPDVGLNLLKGEDIEITVLDGKPKKSAIIAALKKEAYNGMITLLTDEIDSEVLDAVGSDMRIIANYAVGFNNIDIAAAKERGILVTNTPGVLTETVAEHTVALVLAVATRVVEADTFVRQKKFTGWEPELLLGLDLQGKTLGILGAGRIGSRVAEILSGFGMETVYYDVHPNEHLEKTIRAKRQVAPEDVLRTADVISIHLPLNAETIHFLNAKRLALLKRNAIVINTSRGPIIEEEALITILQSGSIFGAGLDVFEHEPSVPRALRQLSNVVLTPHTASASVTTRNTMSKTAAKNVIAVLHGGAPLNPVDQ